jgi:hypothetical protein
MGVFPTAWALNIIKLTRTEIYSFVSLHFLLSINDRSLGLGAELTFVRINDLATPPETTHPLMCLGMNTVP